MQTDSDSQSPGATTRRDASFSMAAFAMAIIAIVFATGTFAAAMLANDDGSGSADATPAGPAQRVEVTLGDMFIEPKELTLDRAGPVDFVVTNIGQIAHDFVLPSGPRTAMLDPGESETLSVPEVSGGTEAYCSVPGHSAAGMTMTITVAGGTGGSGDGSAHGGDTATTPGAGDAAEFDFAATVEDAFEARDPLAPLPPNTKNHEITLEVTEEQMEVAPGVTQKLWTFGGSVPGPVLRGKVGDIFTITLVNNGEVDHSIDFHASKVAWNDEMRSIKSGERLVYRYEAKYAGIFMYHCGTAPALHHIGNGMYGAIIIDPPDLDPVDHEYVMVQSEIYLGPEGKEGDLTKMINDDWDAVVFNGYVNQYRDRPIQVEPNESIRVWVLDAGPSENSSFHVVGTVFDTVYKEGAYLLRPADPGGAQALDLQPAQGGFVEFSFDEVGFYPVVTHKFSNVAKGALGLFRAGDAQLATASGH